MISETHSCIKIYNLGFLYIFDNIRWYFINFKLNYLSHKRETVRQIEILKNYKTPGNTEK